MKNNRGPLFGSMVLLLTSVIWGLAFVAQSAGMRSVGPFTFQCVRSFLGLLTILPVLILCLPTTVATVPAMCIAFASGLAVDFLAEGTLGLNALSLVPVAFIRKGLVGLIFGMEPFEHKESISLKKYGFAKMSVAILLSLGLFLVIYILAECAFTRPLWFLATRAGVSLLASYAVCILIVNLLTDDARK